MCHLHEGPKVEERAASRVQDRVVEKGLSRWISRASISLFNLKQYSRGRSAVDRLEEARSDNQFSPWERCGVASRSIPGEGL